MSFQSNLNLDSHTIDLLKQRAIEMKVNSINSYIEILIFKDLGREYKPQIDRIMEIHATRDHGTS